MSNEHTANKALAESARLSPATVEAQKRAAAERAEILRRLGV